MKIELEKNETELLDSVLESQLAALQHEIHYTDEYFFKKHLKEKRSLLEGILNKFRLETKHAAGVKGFAMSGKVTKRTAA